MPGYCRAILPSSADVCRCARLVDACGHLRDPDRFIRDRTPAGGAAAVDASPRGLIAQGDGERLKGRYAEALALYESARVAAEDRARHGVGRRRTDGHRARAWPPAALDLARDHARRSLALRPEAGRSAEAAANAARARPPSSRPAAITRRRSTSASASLAIYQHRGHSLGIATALSCIGAADAGWAGWTTRRPRTNARCRCCAGCRYLPAGAHVNNLGVLRVSRGDYAAALDAYREALPLHESLGHTPDIARTLINMAIAWRLQGNNRLALEYHQRGLAMAERTGSRRSSPIRCRKRVGCTRRKVRRRLRWSTIRGRSRSTRRWAVAARPRCAVVHRRRARGDAVRSTPLWRCTSRL